MNKPAPIVLGTVDRTSPSVWAHMRLCRLRSLLSVNALAQNWVLHDPRAWLGTAFHRVMKAANVVGPAGSLESAWKQAVDELLDRAAQHPLDRRFSTPEKWHSYFIVRQRALALASEKARTIPIRDTQRTPLSSPLQRGSELRFEARGGKLVGRPDYYDGSTIIEYKSSLPNAEWSMTPVILEEFRRQLRLYAAIIGESTGRYPNASRIVAASGEVLNVPIERAACTEEADAAVSAMDSLNNLVRTSAPAEQMAAVSQVNCWNCSFKLICEAFWQSPPDAAPGVVTGVALAGFVKSIQGGIDGDLYSLALDVKASTHTLVPTQSIVLRKSIHGDLSPDGGKECRIVDGRTGPDGRIRADISTVVARVSELPTLTTSPR
jgi:PD-(D/E)XK nuclease superfamily